MGDLASVSNALDFSGPLLAPGILEVDLWSDHTLFDLFSMFADSSRVCWAGMERSNWAGLDWCNIRMENCSPTGIHACSTRAEYGVFLEKVLADMDITSSERRPIPGHAWIGHSHCLRLFYQRRSGREKLGG